MLINQYLLDFSLLYTSEYLMADEFICHKFRPENYYWWNVSEKNISASILLIIFDKAKDFSQMM